MLREYGASSNRKRRFLTEAAVFTGLSAFADSGEPLPVSPGMKRNNPVALSARRVGFSSPAAMPGGIDSPEAY
jgi:hypothetical protein